MGRPLPPHRLAALHPDPPHSLRYRLIHTKMMRPNQALKTEVK